jgi:hypothetical protein
MLLGDFREFKVILGESFCFVKKYTILGPYAGLSPKNI